MTDFTQRLAEFAHWALENGPFDGRNLDGADVQEKAAALGLIEHDKVRERWWVYTEAFRTALRADGETLGEKK